MIYEQKQSEESFKYIVRIAAIILALVVLGLLFGCSQTTTDITNKFQIPDGLKDCKVYQMRNESGTTLYAIRCPNSTTGTSQTTSSGKSSTTIHVMVTDL